MNGIFVKFGGPSEKHKQKVSSILRLALPSRREMETIAKAVRWHLGKRKGPLLTSPMQGTLLAALCFTIGHKAVRV